ncbi:GumC family protein [Rubripirellula amarantea]|uniref:Tyrosine kinase n=1 Tax=Rubripirellula amarantea TaxID=2527999 RepID=A0A5C5WFT2_9BACT|nr:GumC family protein [Rubripirellula amarantea]MDA8745579.1 GumC family protein [Rubripirellula amarantea]TWT49716.1 tyrosine kinase [Rubripirellula amarantea]
MTRSPSPDTTGELPEPPPGLLVRFDASVWTRLLRATWLPTLLAAGTIALLTIVVLLTYPRVYRSHAKLLLQLGRESVTLDPTAAATGQMMPLHQTRDHEIETALNVMQSRSLLAAVVDEVGESAILKGLPHSADGNESTGGVLSSLKSVVKAPLTWVDPVPSDQRAIRQLGKSLQISAGRDSSVVDIEYRTKSPELAQSVVDCWVENYISHHNDFHRSKGTYAFFKAELSKLHQQLSVAQAKLREEKNRVGLLSLEGERLLLEGEMAAVRNQLHEVEGALAASESRRKKLSQELTRLSRNAVVEETSSTSDSLETMRSKLFELEVIEQELASRYTQDHPRLVSTRRQLDETRQLLNGQSNRRDEVTTGLNPTYQRIETELALENASSDALSKKHEVVQEQLKSLADDVQLLNSQSETIANLERDLKILDAQYLLQSERLEQSRLEQVLQEQRITSVRVIQPASLENRPVSPNKLLCVFAGGLATLGALVGIPLLLGPGRVAKKDLEPKDKDDFYRPSDWDSGDTDERSDRDHVDSPNALGSRRDVAASSGGSVR